MKLTTVLYAADTAPRHKYVVTLTAAERADLDRLVRTGTRSARHLTAARLLLNADAGPHGPAWTDAQLMASFDVSEDTISRLRRRFVEGGLAAALTRKPLSGHFRKVDGRAEAQLVALACSPPPEGAARWTLALLTERFVALDGMPAVSDETVRTILKKTASNPGR